MKRGFADLRQRSGSVELFESSRLLYGRDGIWNEARASVAAEKKPRAMDDSYGPLPGMNARGSSPYCTWNTRAAVVYLSTGQTYVCTASKQVNMDTKMYP